MTASAPLTHGETPREFGRRHLRSRRSASILRQHVRDLPARAAWTLLVVAETFLIGEVTAFVPAYLAQPFGFQSANEFPALTIGVAVAITAALIYFPGVSIYRLWGYRRAMLMPVFGLVLFASMVYVQRSMT
jgi:hypothetical protein